MSEDDPTCMYCGELIADTNAPARFCSQACFDTLLKNVKAQWDQRFREARANGNEANGNGAAPAKPKLLSELMKLRKPAEPKPPLMLLPLDVRPKSEDATASRRPL